MLALLLAALPPSGVLACEPGLAAPAAVLETARFRLAYRSEPVPLPEGQPFALAVAVCGKTGPPPRRLSVDADMPAHRHSMNYRPRIQAQGDGRFRVEGMFFHMPGSWRIAFEADGERAEHAVVVD